MVNKHKVWLLEHKKDVSVFRVCLLYYPYKEKRYIRYTRPVSSSNTGIVNGLVCHLV